MRTVEKATKYFAMVNLLVGATGFVGPLVSGNKDRFINIRPGLLLGVFAINWLHALLHVATGVAGLLLRRPGGMLSYMSGVAALFGVVAGAGWLRGRGKTGIYMVMGMALNLPDNILHTIWAGYGAAWAVRDRALQERT